MLGWSTADLFEKKGRKTIFQRSPPCNVMSDLPMSYRRMCLRFERYFESVDTPPDDPPGWHQYVESMEGYAASLKDVSELNYGSKAFQDKVQNGTGAKSDGTRLKENTPDKQKTVFSTEIATACSEKYSDSQAEDTPDRFGHHPEPPCQLTLKVGKQNENDFLGGQNLMAQAKRSVTVTNPQHETSAAMRSSNKVKGVKCERMNSASLPIIEKSNRNENYQEQDDISPLEQAASISSNSLSFRHHILENFEAKLIENNADVSKSLSSDTVQLIFGGYNSQRRVALKKLQTFQSIQHLVNCECNENLDEVISAKFWEERTRNRQFSPPHLTPEGLFATTIQRENYSQIVREIEQKKLQLRKLSNELQKCNQLKSLTAKMSKAAEDPLDPFQKSLALQNALEVRVDVEELLEGRNMS